MCLFFFSITIVVVVSTKTLIIPRFSRRNVSINEPIFLLQLHPPISPRTTIPPQKTSQTSRFHPFMRLLRSQLLGRFDRSLLEARLPPQSRPELVRRDQGEADAAETIPLHSRELGQTPKLPPPPPPRVLQRVFSRHTLLDPSRVLLHHRRRPHRGLQLRRGVGVVA